MLEQEAGSAQPESAAEIAPPTAPGKPSPAPSPEASRPFSEFSGGVRRALLISWGLFALVVVVAFSGKLEVMFNLGVVVTFGAVFFGVPLVLLRIKRGAARKAESYVDTLNGRMSQGEAMLQVIMVPLILSVGMAVIGYFATHQ